MATAEGSGSFGWAAASHRPPWRWVVVSVALAALLGATAWWLVYERAVEPLRGAAASRLETYAASLAAELRRHEVLPTVLALDTRLVAALGQPRSRAALDAADRFLREAQRGAGVEAVYLIGPDGLTLAASNFDQRGSFVGQNYAFRPYVQAALQGRLGRFYAVGATTGQAGYFLAAPVHVDGVTAGVVAVKVLLDEFETLLSRSGDLTLVSDARGVVFLASQRRLRYATLGPLSAADQAGIAATRQYTGASLRPIEPGVDLRRVPSVQRLPAVADAPLLVVHTRLLPWGWQLTTLAPVADARRWAALAAAAVMLGALACSGALLVWRQRAERRRELRSLDAHIRERIARSTEHLQQRLAEQARTEALLRETTDAAVQAGKLAVLGQMAVGISHELNQPLTAVRNYTDNAIALLDAGHPLQVGSNLQRIAALVERMTTIVAHLRSHARKQPEPVGAVDVRQAVDGAVQLLHGGGQGGPVDVDGVPDRLWVRADVVRLEQVLVNLLRNAREAAGPEGRVAVHAAPVDGAIEIRVEDDGPGLAPDALAHLFEPFFTTKQAGQGLGLGLSVSRMIVEGYGGRLEAANRPEGGAVFNVRLLAAAQEAEHVA